MTDISKFKAFVLRYIDEEKWQILDELIGYNKFALGKVFKKPETATHELVLKISEVIEVHPHILITEHGLGVKNLSDIEKKHYQMLFELEQQEQELVQSQS